MSGSTARAPRPKRIFRILHALVAASLIGTMPGARAVNPRDLLDPSEAFRISVTAFDSRAAEIEFRIAPGYYLYRHRFRFQTEDGRLIAAVLPAGKTKNDEFFGRTEIYHDSVRIRLPLDGAAATNGRIRLKVVSQGCADIGVCYVPEERWIEVKLER